MLDIRYEEDLKSFFELYESKHVYPYFCISKEKISEFIKEYLNKHKIIDDYDFAYMLKIIEAKLSGVYDAHMFLGMPNGITLPIVSRYVGKDLVIYKTSLKYEDLIGFKILKINGVPLTVLEKEAIPTIAYSTKSWFKRELAAFSSGVNRLLTLPSIDPSSEEFDYELEKDGTKKHVIINKKETIDRWFDYDNYEISIYDNTVILHYNKCYEKYENQVELVVKKIKKIIEENKSENFILDLRGNTGGNSEAIKPLINYLKESNLNLYAFCDQETFSSGIFALADMKRIGAIIIGEEPGCALNTFGDIDKFKLPNTGFSVTFSKKYFIFSLGEMRALKSRREIDEAKQEVTKLNLLKPDIEIEVSYDDIINKVDSCLEAYKNIGNKNHIKR